MGCLYLGRGKEWWLDPARTRLRGRGGCRVAGVAAEMAWHVR